jgi:hypothetical protein
MDGEFSRHRKVYKIVKILGRLLKGKRILGRPRYSCYDDVKVDAKKYFLRM